METAPAFQFYVREWRSSRAVLRMSFAERGMYLEMLLEQWEKKSLPDNPDECAELIGGTPEEWRAAWPTLRRKFVTDLAGRIYNVRLERVREELYRFKAIAQESGTRGGKKRASSAARGKNGAFLPADSQLALESSQGQPDTDLICTDLNSTELKKNGGEAPHASPSANATGVLSFSVIGVGPSTWVLTEAQVTKWQSAYPSLDIVQECRKALAWLDAKPTRRKTHGGMPVFLVNWFNRSVERGGGQRPAAARPGWERKPSAPARACPHVVECASASQCANALQVDPLGKRYPLKAVSA